jgi:hypothetical protein
MTFSISNISILDYSSYACSHQWTFEVLNTGKRLTLKDEKKTTGKTIS